jgi:hypothetical protein
MLYEKDAHGCCALYVLAVVVGSERSRADARLRVAAQT